VTDDLAGEIAEEFAGMPQHQPLIAALRLVSKPDAWMVERNPATVVLAIGAESALYVLVANEAAEPDEVEVTTRRRTIDSSTIRIEVAGPSYQAGRYGLGLARTWRFYFEDEPQPIELHGFEQLEGTEPVAHSPAELVARVIARLAGWNVESLGPTRVR
jgi:hypothetical protein